MKKHMKKMLTIPGHKRMQIKTTLRFYLTPVTIAIIRNTNVEGAGMQGKRTPHTLLVEI
jgi:hypothetical protein